MKIEFESIANEENLQIQVLTEADFSQNKKTEG